MFANHVLELVKEFPSKNNKASITLHSDEGYFWDTIMIKRMIYKEQVLLAEQILEYIDQSNYRLFCI